MGRNKMKKLDSIEKEWEDIKEGTEDNYVEKSEHTIILKMLVQR